MQRTIRPWITAGVALAGAGVIAVTPVVAPNTEHRAVALTTLDQDLADWQQILAGVIDPGVAGAAAQAADTAALTDLGSGEATYYLSDAELHDNEAAEALAFAQQDITANDFDGGHNEDIAAEPLVSTAASDAANAHEDAAQAVAALSAADPIQVFETDLQADWSQLVSGDVFSSTTLADLTATLNAAPAAAQEFLAELIDPAAAGEVTAYDDANMAAELATTAAQQYDAAKSALTDAINADPATAAGDQTIAADTATAVSDFGNASTDLGQSTTDVTDAINAVDSATPTVTLADLGTDLGTLWSSVLADLGL